MKRPYVLAGLAGGLLVAVFAGVTIGNAAVEGINPAHYRPAPVARPRPVIAADPSRTLIQRPPAYREPYGWEDGGYARAADCGSACEEREGVYSARVPYFGSREEMESAERAARRTIDRAFAAQSEAALDRKPREAASEAEKPERGVIEDVITVGEIYPE